LVAPWLHPTKTWGIPSVVGSNDLSREKKTEVAAVFHRPLLNTLMTSCVEVLRAPRIHEWNIYLYISWILWGRAGPEKARCFRDAAVSLRFITENR